MRFVLRASRANCWTATTWYTVTAFDTYHCVTLFLVLDENHGKKWKNHGTLSKKIAKFTANSRPLIDLKMSHWQSLIYLFHLSLIIYSFSLSLNDQWSLFYNNSPDNTGSSKRRKLDVVIRLRLRLQASGRRIDVKTSVEIVCVRDYTPSDIGFWGD